MVINMDEYEARCLFPNLVSFDIMPGLNEVAILNFKRFYLMIRSKGYTYIVEGYSNWGQQQLFMDEVPLQDMGKYAEQFQANSDCAYAGHNWLCSKSKYDTSSLDSDLYPRI